MTPYTRHAYNFCCRSYRVPLFVSMRVWARVEVDLINGTGGGTQPVLEASVANVAWARVLKLIAPR